MAENKPTVFADVISSLYWTSDVVKMWLMEFEADPYGMAPLEQKPITQVVMPMQGFINSAVFIQNRLEAMIKAGVIRQEDVDTVKQQLASSQASNGQL